MIQRKVRIIVVILVDWGGQIRKKCGIWLILLSQLSPFCENCSLKQPAPLLFSCRQQRQQIYKYTSKKTEKSDFIHSDNVLSEDQKNYHWKGALLIYTLSGPITAATISECDL